MKTVAIALLVGCAMFVPPHAVHAQGPNRLYPDLQPPTLVPSIPVLGPTPQPRVSPGGATQPTPPPRQDPPTEAPPSPAASLVSSPTKAESSEQAPAPVPSQPGTGFPWWPVICAALVVMLVYRVRRRT